MDLLLSVLEVNVCRKAIIKVTSIYRLHFFYQTPNLLNRTAAAHQMYRCCIRARCALEALRNALYKCSTYLFTYYQTFSRKVKSIISLSIFALP